jgi:hypothetical protein
MIFLGHGDPVLLPDTVIEERMDMCLAEAGWPLTKAIVVDSPRTSSGWPCFYLGRGPKPPNEILWRVVRMVFPGACWSCWLGNGDSTQRAKECAEGRCADLGPQYPPSFGS